MTLTNNTNRTTTSSSATSSRPAVRSASLSSSHQYPNPNNTHLQPPPLPVGLDLFYTQQHHPNNAHFATDPAHSRFLGTSIISAPTIASTTSFYAPPTFVPSALYRRHQQHVPNEYLTGAGLFQQHNGSNITNGALQPAHRNTSAALLPASAPLVPGAGHPGSQQQQAQQPGNNNSNVTGKRFLRRAKRWAVLQQKKQLLAAAAAVGTVPSPLNAVQKSGTISSQSSTESDKEVNNENKFCIDSVTGSPLINLHRHQHAQLQQQRGLRPPPIKTKCDTPNFLPAGQNAMALQSAPCDLNCLAAVSDSDSSDQDKRDRPCACEDIDESREQSQTDLDRHQQQQQLAAANVFSAFHSHPNAGSMPPTPTSATSFFIDDVAGQYNYSGLMSSPSPHQGQGGMVAFSLGDVPVGSSTHSQISVANTDLLTSWSTARNVLSTTTPGVIDLNQPPLMMRSRRQVSDVSCSDDSSSTTGRCESRSSPVDLTASSSSTDTATTPSGSGSPSSRASPETLPEPNTNDFLTVVPHINQLSRSMHDMKMIEQQRQLIQSHKLQHSTSLLGNPIIASQLPSPYYLMDSLAVARHLEFIKSPLHHMFPPTQVHTQPPPQRELVYVRRDFLNREQPIALVSVMCYNVLCDKYATTNLYSYCPSWALNWEYRKTAILKEIKSFDADVVTLQEVETEQYQKLFLPELEQLGYTGIFSPKSRAKTMQEEEKKYVDGCAVFWKVEKFELEREHLIEFTQIAIAKAEGSEHMLNRVMTRDNIGLVAVLKVKQNVYHNSMQLPPTPHENVVGNPLVVCTAHIHWDPEFCDVKLVQTMMLVNELAKVIEDVGRTFRIDPQHVSTLLCGDLNSLPDSGVFDYLTQSGVSADHPDFKEFRNSGMECLQSFSSSNSKTRYTHPLVLKSAYDKDSTVLPFTNYTLDFKGVIDYIMASPGLCKISVLGPLDPGWVQSNKIIGCPHPHVPSDHIPLYVQYAIVPPSVLQFRQQSEQQQQRQQQQQSSQQQQHQRNNSGMSQLQHFMQHGMSSNSQNGFAHTFGQLGSR